MATVHEIADDVFRICTYAPDFNLQFCQFLIRDDEPLLFHTGMRGMFADTRDAVARVIDPAKIRWISFSHYEADESGALDEWLEAAPGATVAASFVGAMVNLMDVCPRPPRGLQDDEGLETGKRRFRFLSTPHVPHSWDAGLLFEETTKTLLCSDLFDHPGDVEPVTESDVLGRSRANLLEAQKGPFADYLPYTAKTAHHLGRLAALGPTTLATMHGSTFRGDGAKALADLDGVLREVFGSPDR